MGHERVCPSHLLRSERDHIRISVVYCSRLVGLDISKSNFAVSCTEYDLLLRWPDKTGNGALLDELVANAFLISPTKSEIKFQNKILLVFIISTIY